MDTVLATLKLFNAIQIENNTGTPNKHGAGSIRHMLENGYFVDTSVKVNGALLSKIDDLIGIGGEKVNSAFHKSWSKVAKASDRQLLLEQMVHYVTTYGFEAVGIYAPSTVYIPAEELNVPSVTEDLPITFIRGLTANEILQEIINLDSSGIALSQDTLDAIMSIVKENDYNHEMYLDEIQNRELSALLCEFYGIIPSEPMAYLRYVIAKLTGESLVIKNRYLIEKIKQSDRKVLDSLLLDAPENLASIFLRFKPLFLAMKSISKNKTFFNRLRKDAVNMHEPVALDYLSGVTAMIDNGKFSLATLKKSMGSYSVWRKIRLAYALNNRLSGIGSIVYRVRNGRGWVTDFSSSDAKKSKYTTALSAVVGAISNDIAEKVADKVVYIPANVHYALPQSEKMFTGNAPSNSYVSSTEDFVFGIHWFNNESDSNGYHRGKVDLDLSLIDQTGKYGWDASYRNQGRDIMFSGDITDAPKPMGATELFFVGSTAVSAKLISVNYFNFVDGNSVDNCQLIVGQEQASKNQRNYMIDPNNIIMSQNVVINKKQNIIGLVVGVNGENRVYFFNSAIGNSITSRDDENSRKIREFLLNTCVASIDLKDVLELAGAIVVDEIPEDGEYLDLSPEALNKSTIIDLFNSN